MYIKMNHCVKFCITAIVLLFLVVSSVVAEIEPNNTITTAQPVALPSNETGALSKIEPFDTSDVFKVTLTENGYFSFGIVPEPELDVSAELIDSDGFSVLSSGNAGGVGVTEGVIYSNLKKSNYYCIVHLVDGNGGYEARFRFSQVESVDVEPNDVPLQAVSMGADDDVVGNLGFHGNRETDKSDFYRIELTSDGELELTAAPDASLDLTLHLLDTDGTNIILEDTNSAIGQSEALTASDLAAGTYYVLVYNASGYGAYSLTSAFTANPQPNDAEPNDAISQAISFPSLVSVGDHYSAAMNGRTGYFVNQYRDDRDWYAFQVPEYSRIELEYTQDYGSPELGYGIYDSQRRYIAGSASTKFNIGVLEAGTYYINFYRRNNYGAYSLEVRAYPETQPETFSGTAGTYTLGQTLASVPINADSPVMYYWFDLAQDSSVWFKMSAPDTLYLTTKIYGPKGLNTLGSLSAYYTNDPKELTLPNMLAGRYLMAIARDNGQGNVTIESAVTPSLYHEAEPNDIWTDAILVGEDALIQGHMGHTNSRWTDTADTYRVDLSSDGAIRVDFHGENTLYFSVEMFEYFGSTWKRIFREGLYYTDETVIKTLSSPNLKKGTYYVQVQRENGYGDYELDLSFTPNHSGDLEPNFHPYQAITVESEQGITGHLGYVGGFNTDTMDWYKIVTPSDGTLEAYAQAEDSLYYDLQFFRDDASTGYESAGSYYTKNPVRLKNVQVKAGVTYIRMLRNNGYGVYQLFTKFTPNATPDIDLNNLAAMAEPLSINQISQGSLGFNNRTTIDNIDWYQLSVTTEASYTLAYQTESTLYSDIRVYDASSLNRLSSDGVYYHSNLLTRNLTLQPGIYYVYCIRNNGAGSYTLSVGDGTAPSTGVLTGTVFDKNQLEIFEVDVSAYGQSVKTDFSGVYTFEHLPPGRYTVTLGKGAKYYQQVLPFEIIAGQTTTLDVVLREANLNPPAEVEHYYGFAGNGTMHLFWDPTVSPDVADGGGYNLYINGEKHDLGTALYFRDFGFTNGVTYEMRLTVYDKFDNESAGKTLYLTPSGEGQPNPTPTPVGPTSTPVPGQPTNTPTPKPGTPTLPPPTLTPTPTIPVVVPTPTPIVPETLEPDYVYEFDGGTLAECSWGEIVQNPPGQTQLIDFIHSFIPDSTDGKGLALTVFPYDADGGEKLNYVFLYGAPAIRTTGKHVYMRMTARASDPNVSVFIAAMKADFSTFDIEGSLVVTNPATAKALTDKPSYVTCMFPADPATLNIQTGKMEVPEIPITPIIQIAASAAATEPVVVWVDKLEVFLLDPAKSYPASLFDLSIE